jgi:hypothetical protein
MLIVVFGQMVMIMNRELYSSLLVCTSATWLLYSFDASYV